MSALYVQAEPWCFITKNMFDVEKSKTTAPIWNVKIMSVTIILCQPLLQLHVKQYAGDAPH